MILDVLLICITMIIIVYMLTNRGQSRDRRWGGWGWNRPWWPSPVVYGGRGGKKH